MDPLSLETKTRTTFGKKLRSLRKDGTLPLHVYGPGMESISLQSDTNKVVKILGKIFIDFCILPISIAHRL